MIRPRWRKVFSDLWGNRLRSLLVVASITIGLFAVGLIATMHAILTEDMRFSYAAVNPANIQFSTAPFTEELLRQVQEMPGVAQVMGQNSLTLRAWDGEQWIPLEVRAIQDIDELAINLVQVEQGIWPPRERELAVDRFKFPDLNTTLGGNLRVQLQSGRNREIPLTSVVQDQTIGAFDAGGGFFLAPAQAYVSLETLEWLEELPYLDTLYVTASENPDDLTHLRSLASRLSDEIEDAGTPVFRSAVQGRQEHPNRVYVEAIASVLFMLGLLVMFLSAFLITNTLSALLNQQIGQIGVMKTIGGKRGQIMAIYMLLIFVFSMVALAIAIPLASRLGYSLLSTLTGEINVVLRGYRLIPLAMLLQTLIALVIPQVAGFYPIWQGTRVSAVEAMSGYNQGNPPGRTGWIDRQLHRLRKVPRPMLISLRNTFRRKGRLFLTLITLTLGGAIFIATFNVRGSLDKFIGRIGKYFLADVNITLENYVRNSEIRNLLLQDPAVDLVEGWAYAGGEVDVPGQAISESFSILAPPAGSSLVDPLLLEGRWIEPGDVNVFTLNERFRELFPDLQVGQTLTVNIFGEEAEMQVVGFFQLAGKSSGFLAYTSYESLAPLIHQENKANSFRITAHQTGLTLVDQKALGAKLENLLESNGYQVQETVAGLSLTETTTDGLTILTGFLLIMASLIAIVGSIGLTGTLSMNVLERTREIGIMRSIGANNRTLRNLVMVEGLLIGMISWLAGTVLAFPISTALSNAINFALFGAPVPFTFTPTGIALWFLVVFVLSVLASVLPARNSARLTIREVLSYE